MSQRTPDCFPYLSPFLSPQTCAVPVPCNTHSCLADALREQSATGDIDPEVLTGV